MGKPKELIESKKAQRLAKHAKPGIYVNDKLIRSDSSPDYKLACIRDYIRDNSGKVLSSKDIAEAAGITSPIAYIKKLIASGKVTRQQSKDGKQGLRYIYTYHDTPVKPNSILVTQLNLPELPIEQRALEQIDKLFLKYADEKFTGEYLAGAAKFKKYMNDEFKKARDDRDAILRERQVVS